MYLAAVEHRIVMWSDKETPSRRPCTHRCNGANGVSGRIEYSHRKRDTAKTSGQGGLGWNMWLA